MNCFSNVLRCDKAVNVKRAALSAIVMLIDGLSGDIFQVFHILYNLLYYYLHLLFIRDSTVHLCMINYTLNKYSVCHRGLFLSSLLDLCFKQCS